MNDDAEADGAQQQQFQGGDARLEARAGHPKRGRALRVVRSRGQQARRVATHWAEPIQQALVPAFSHGLAASRRTARTGMADQSSVALAKSLPLATLLDAVNGTFRMKLSGCSAPVIVSLWHGQLSERIS